MFRRNYSNRSRFHGDRPQGSSQRNNYNSGRLSRDMFPDYDQASHYGPRTGHSDDWPNGYSNFQDERNFTNFNANDTPTFRNQSTLHNHSPNPGIDLSSRWPTFNSTFQNFSGSSSHTSDSSKIGLPNMQVFQTPNVSSYVPNTFSNISHNHNLSNQGVSHGSSAYSTFSGSSRDQSTLRPETSQSSPFSNISSSTLNQNNRLQSIVNTCKLPPYEQVAGLQSRPSSNPFSISTPSKFFGRSEAPMDSIAGKPAGNAEGSIQPGQFVLLEPFPQHLNAGPMTSNQQYKEQVWKKLRADVDNDTTSLQRNWKLTNYELLPRDESCLLYTSPSPRD